MGSYSDGELVLIAIQMHTRSVRKTNGNKTRIFLLIILLLALFVGLPTLGKATSIVGQRIRTYKLSSGQKSGRLAV